MRVMNLLRRERESAGEEGAGCIQEVKEDKNSQLRGCYSDVSGICLTNHSSQRNVFRSVLGETWESSSSGSRSAPLYLYKLHPGYARQVLEILA